nr:unnamed protein product [Callosobruchus analis]
MREKRLTR